MSTGGRCSGVRPILPSRTSNMLLLAKSLPAQCRTSSKGTDVDAIGWRAINVCQRMCVLSVADGKQTSRKISVQCAGVARVSRMPVTGLPPRPRLIMTPPSSPRENLLEGDDDRPPKAQSSPATPAPASNEFLIRPESFKILSQSPKKVVIEVEHADQLEGLGGLLSQHFALRESPLSDPVTTPTQDQRDSSDASESVYFKREPCVVTCRGRSLDDMATRDERGIDAHQQEDEQKLSKSLPSRRAQAINILKAKKEKERYTTTPALPLAMYALNRAHLLQRISVFSRQSTFDRHCCFRIQSKD